MCYSEERYGEAYVLFDQYLREVGMFSEFADMEDSKEVEKAKKRYLDALTIAVKEMVQFL